MVLTTKMLDELVGDCKSQQDVEKLYSQMLQHMINRSLEAEMQAHLGHARRRPTGAGNPRNGKGCLLGQPRELAGIVAPGISGFPSRPPQRLSA